MKNRCTNARFFECPYDHSEKLPARPSWLDSENMPHSRPRSRQTILDLGSENITFYSGGQVPMKLRFWQICAKSRGENPEMTTDEHDAPWGHPRDSLRW